MKLLGVLFDVFYRENAGSANGAWMYGYVRTTFEMADSLTAVHLDSGL